MSSTTHISPTQDTGGNVNYLPNSCNISDISMISVYWSDIMNKPGFCNVSITGSYNDLLNVPSLSTVAFSGDYNSLSNRPWINSNSNIYNNNQGNVGIGTNNPTEKLHLVGNFSISGDIIPAINSNFNLGSSNYKWKDLYLSGNSIYLDNLIISKNSSNNLEIRDSDNNLRSISLNQLELNDGDNKLRFLYSNGALVFNSNGINIQGIEFSNYSKIIYSNNLYTTSNTIIDYTNYRINNLNFNTGGGGNGATININTDTIQIGTSNKFITSNIYDSNITFMNNLNVNGSYQLNNCNIPFSLMKFTNITTTNGVFTYNASSNDFGYFSFVNSGTITFPQMTDCDVLVVGAGGNGGTGTLSGGGGAGEVIAYPSYSFPSGTYTIQVGTSGTSSNNRISKISSNSVDFLLAKGGADGYGIQSNITSTTLKYGISNNTLIDYNYSNLTTLSSGTSNFIFSTDGSIIITSNNYSSVSTLTPRNWYKFDDPSNIGIDSGSSPVNLSVVNTSPSFDTNNVIKGASSMLNIRNTTTPNYLRANINLSTPFTIAFWFYMNSDNDHAPFGLATNQSGTSPLISCQYVTTNDKELTTYLAAPSLWTAFGTDNIIITHFRWYHYVLTVSSANPTVCTVYINGVLSKSQNGTGAFNTNSGVNTLFVNIRGDISASMPFGGNIDDFRIYSSVLTASQVSELFNSTIDRSYPILRSINNDEITPIAWYKFDNNLTDMVNDSSVNGFTLTNTSVTFNSTKFAKGNGAAEMSTTNYFSSTNATLTSYIHQNSYSISCWIYPKSTTNGFSLSFGGNGAIRQWVGYGCFLASRYGFAHVGVTTGTQDLYSSAYAQDLNTWVHVTFTFDKNTSARVIYRNGVSIANTTSGALTLSQNLFYVGRYIDTSTLPMNGLIDDLRIYNFALSEAQVQELYQGRLRIFASSSNNQGGSGGGGATNINLTTSIGSKWNSNYSYISSGYIGTSNQGGNGGGANSNMGLTTSLVTGSALTIGEGGLGATSTSIPISKNTYGSGGDGNGGTGTNGIVIIKVPLNTCNVKFDGFIYSSNIFDLNYNTITLMSFASNQLNASIVNTSNKLIDYDNLIDKPWINSNLIIYNNNQGNVGIGTNNPISKLDVSGDINFTGTLKLNQRTLPFSVYSNTNILSSNGLFSYIPNNVFFGYYTFLTNGTITFPQTTSCDIIVVGAGGNGGINNLSGGGGAGEVIAYQGYSFTTGIYNIQIGTTNDINSSNLRNSIISSNNSALITAKGGGDGAYTIYNISGSGSYLTSNLSSNNIYFAFTSNVSSLVLYESITCDILVVGGGGAGGQRSGGGGGAGALIYQTNKTLNAGNYSITVGSGGAGAPITTSITPSSGNDGGD